MLSQCANKQCCKPFLKLRDGKLFLVETERVRKPGESVSPRLCARDSISEAWSIIGSVMIARLSGLWFTTARTE